MTYARLWSYGGFHNFRKSIAKLAGINLDKMIGYNKQLGKSWAKYKDDPIVILLNHSDCDGDISPEDCAKLHPRLAELSIQLTDDYDKENGLLLADMCKIAAETSNKLIFC